MLTQLNQFTVIKSHPNLQKKHLSTSQDAKFSLQLPKSNLFNRKISRKNLISKNNITTNPNLYNAYLSQKQNKTNHYLECFSGLATSQYFKQQQNICSQKNHLINSHSKIPSILTPKQLFSLSNQKNFFPNKMKILRNSNHQEIIKKKQQKTILLSYGLQGSSQKNSIPMKIPFNGSFQYTLLTQSKRTEQDKGDEYFLQSSSALKQNLFSITKSAKLQNIKNNFSNKTTKRALQRSNSFRKAIEVSREKRKEPNQKGLGLSGNQMKIFPFNRQYYLVANNDKENRDPNPNPNARFKQNLKQSRLIKSPQEKLIKENKRSMFQLNKQEQVKAMNKVFCSRQSKKEQKKVESFMEDTVNNSHMFSFNADQKSLNMEPF